MPEDPRLWFQLVEDCFELQRAKEGAGTVMPDKQKLIMIGAKVPGHIIRQHKAHYFARNYEAFKNAVCGIAIKTDASLFREFMGAKLTEGMSPSTFVQQLLVIVGNLADNSPCRTPRKVTTCDKDACKGDCGPGSMMGGKEHILLKWLLKNALETQLPEHMAAVLNSIPFTIEEYLNMADRLYANHRAKTAAGTASVETCVAALSQVGADEALIAAFKQAGKNRRRDNNNNNYSRGNTQSNKPRKCLPHEKYGRAAWTCWKGECPDKDLPLASKPKKDKKKDAAAAESPGVLNE